MIRLNPEQDSQAAFAIRLAREGSPYRSNAAHVVSVWASFRKSFVNHEEFLQAVCKGRPHLYAEYLAAVEAWEVKWLKTDGVTEMVKRVRW